jgi:hypothetical protein
MMSNSVEELGDVINYLMGFTKFVKLYVDITKAFSYETLVDLDSKILLNLGCNPICYSARREEYVEHTYYNMYYQCDDLIVNLKDRLNKPAGFPKFWCEEEPTSLFVKMGVAVPLPRSNFFVDFGSLSGSIEIGLKDEVSISLKLDNLFFTRVEKIYGYADNSISIIVRESSLKSRISIDIKLAKEVLERKNIEITPFHEYIEYKEKLVNNPENAYKLATSLLAQLCNNPTFRSNMDKVISFLEKFLRAHTTMMLY